MKTFHPGGTAQHFKAGWASAFKPHGAAPIGMFWFPGYVKMAATATACAAVMMFPWCMHER